MNYLKYIWLFVFNISFVTCLYEDQIGKFDWKQKFIGAGKFAYLDPHNLDEVIIATEENVLAAVKTKTGELLRRVVFEDDPRGEILLLQGPTDRGSHLNREYDVLTVSGRNPSIVRGWNAKTLNLEFEWNLNLLNPTTAGDILWFYDNHFLYHVTPVWGSHLEVVSYIANSGETTKATASKIAATWIRKETCTMSGSYFACLVKNQILSLNLLGETVNIQTVTVDADEKDSIVAVVGHTAVRVKNQIVLLDESVVVKLKSSADFVAIDAEFEENGALIEVLQDSGNIKVTVSDLKTGNLIEDLTSTSSYPSTLGEPKILTAKCKAKACRLVFATSDESIALVHQGKIRWVREESLTNIDSVDFVDLALSDEEGELEEELKSKGGNVYSAFIRRVSSQIAHAKNIFFHVIGAGPAPSATQRAGLVRDEFGLHKIIVIVTRSGKLFGLDNLSGKQYWMKYLPNFTGFNDDVGLKLIVQRSSKYYPLPPQCAVVGKQKKNGNGILFVFNPLNGQTIGQGSHELNYPIQQFMLLNEVDTNSLRGLLLLDNNNQVHVIPETSKKHAGGAYIYTANKLTGTMAGYFIQFENANLQAIPTWRVQIGGAGNQQKIISVASKNSYEHVHSQGRVLADRSVLYKYLNPNLVAVVTQGNDPIHKYILNVHLLDVVSGSIIFSMSHRRAKGPVNIVHSENWLTYSFFNEKVRRFEVSAIELYEGKTQSNSTVWSSLGSPPLPLIERQIYIMPANISVLKETITEKGITNKHILFGLTSGSILEMNWAFLDPRRPSTNPERAREEGIIPYIPELPIQSESLVNYNQTIERLRGIHTSPSGLESTCLVIAYGLDIFVTRVAPSKTFDLLKEDFDYFLISIVLIALITASYITRHLASKKILKQAWR